MNNKESGRVWLVGAGPSDPGLFTLKGKRVLSEAEVVVYDALVGQGIMSMIPDSAEKINVGKRSSHHTLPQEEISELLAQKAKEGKRVVRLKGGDPFLFGRGGEEIEVLLREKIPFEVVPGVTSALSVPAYQGIPVTHRDFCSSLHIITGHKRAGESYDIDFEALVRTRGTLVFLMGVAALGEICQGLIEAGMSPEVPAALLMRGTTAGQRRIVATVGTLREETERQGACTPAIIVVGEVCALSEQFSWYEKQPLGGVKVLLTRPKELISETAAKLRAKGAEVLELPAIRTERIPDNKRLAQAFARLSVYQWIVFTSPTGVRIFFEEMADREIDCRVLGGVKFAVIGNGTRKALAERGFYADLMPEIFDAAHLGKALAEAAKMNDRSGASEMKRILIPRAAAGSQELIEEIGDAFSVDDVPTYETLTETDFYVDLKKEFAEGTIDYAMFTSASTVRGFAAATPGLDYARVRAVCIGRQTEAAAASLGMHTFTAEQASIDSLIERLCQAVENRKTEDYGQGIREDDGYAGI
ncbi:MAG: uroporphyrinogen-III C-methyltransferase [Lachnospiraceae bacterium]|nr:uroporphyrinogen-III C-methyltransferase [Lachnospiraceae bacterium]